MRKPSISTFNDIYHREKYQQSKIKKKHFGQLKLFLMEICFFNNCKLDKEKQYDILYIGSGPGYHLPVLMDFYERYNFTWHLFDPKGHCKEFEKRDNVFVNDREFTVNDVKHFLMCKNLLFISDIRTANSSDECPTFEHILADQKFQNKIVSDLCPMFSFLKFRYPYPSRIIDFRNHFYIDGIKFIQPFSGNQSTELRVFVPREEINNLKQFSLNEALMFEEKMYWYNKNYRFQNNNDLKIALWILYQSGMIKEQDCEAALNVYHESIVDVIKFNKFMNN